MGFYEKLKNVEKKKRTPWYSYHTDRGAKWVDSRNRKSIKENSSDLFSHPSARLLVENQDNRTEGKDAREVLR